MRDLIDELDRRASILAVEVRSREFSMDPENEAVRARVLGFANDLLGHNNPWQTSYVDLDDTFDARAPSAYDVARALPVGSALVEFVKVQRFEPRRYGFLADFEYWALVLTSGSTPQAVPLGLASMLEPLIAAQLEMLRNVDKLDSKSQLAAMSALYEALWHPLEGLLSGIVAVAIAPDGALAAVPFAALFGRDERFLIERFIFTIVSSGRDLLQVPPVRKVDAQSRIVVIADPDYSLEPLGHAAPPRVHTAWPLPTFDRLRETVNELAAIKEVFGRGAELMTDTAPTKTAVLQIESPVILHFATHGVFQAVEQPPAREDNADAVATRGAYVEYARTLLMAGVALAGANARRDEPDDDGMLTAFDVIGMNLQATELVVLSACDTGRGVAAAGEGFLGLSRSFQVAGARTVVVSLWKLSDREAARQIGRFYGSYARDHVPAAVALAKVQRDRIKWLRTNMGSAPPAFWGALTVYETLRNAIFESAS